MNSKYPEATKYITAVVNEIASHAITSLRHCAPSPKTRVGLDFRDGESMWRTGVQPSLRGRCAVRQCYSPVRMRVHRGGARVALGLTASDAGITEIDLQSGRPSIAG
jgi:hypothetical protein